VSNVAIDSRRTRFRGWLGFLALLLLVGLAIGLTFVNYVGSLALMGGAALTWICWVLFVRKLQPEIPSARKKVLLYALATLAVPILILFAIGISLCTLIMVADWDRRRKLTSTDT
jgi:hypothetical protein